MIHQKFGVTARIVFVCKDNPGACFFVGEVVFVGEFLSLLAVMIVFP